MQRIQILAFIAVMIIAISPAQANKIKLDWVKKQVPASSHCGTYGKWQANKCSAGEFRVLSVEKRRDKFIFDVLAHNTHKSWMQCIYVTANDAHVYMDDEMGNEYKGIKIKFRDGQTNKLNVNQRKRFTLTIPAPQDDISLVNLHLGLHFNNIEDVKNCPSPIVNKWINFEKLDWDISELMTTN